MLADLKRICVEAMRSAKIYTASTTAAEIMLSEEIIKKSEDKSKNDDFNVVVCPLQQHFTFKVNDFALLCRKGIVLRRVRISET